MLFAMIWWFAGAKKWFKGPKVNLEHVLPGRKAQYAEIQPKELSGDSSSETGSVNKLP